MKNLFRVYTVVAIWVVAFTSCEDSENSAETPVLEKEKPALFITVPELTISDDVLTVLFSSDSSLVIDYTITAPGKIRHFTQTVDENEETVSEAKGLEEYSGRLTVNVPFEEKIIAVKFEVTDEDSQVGTKLFSIVVKETAMIINETAVSGGIAELSWSAPTGLADQKLIILTSDTHELTPPDKSVWLGFGEGWLYEQNDGTVFPNIIASGSEQWVVEHNRRFVHIDEQGYRWARTLAKPGGASEPTGGGSINWDSGSELGPGEFTFMYSVSRCAAGINPGATFQWKQDRVRSEKNLEGNDWNSAYITETKPLGTGPRMQAYKGNDAKSCSTPTPQHQGLVHRFGWLWKQNTPDLSDGLARTFLLDDDHPTMVVHTPKNSSGGVQDDVVQSAFPERNRWAMWQDYIGNNNDGAGDIEILRTDMYIQRGGVLLFLADGTTPETTSIAVPLRYVSSDEASNSITLKMWSQGEISYEAASILLFDSDLNFLKGVSLNP